MRRGKRGKQYVSKSRNPYSMFIQWSLEANTLLHCVSSPLCCLKIFYTSKLKSSIRLYHYFGLFLRAAATATTSVSDHHHCPWPETNSPFPPPPPPLHPQMCVVVLRPPPPLPTLTTLLASDRRRRRRRRLQTNPSRKRERERERGLSFFLTRPSMPTFNLFPRSIWRG